MTTFYRRLPRFDYVQPASLDEALSLLDRYKADAKPLAGGTDLIPQVKGREMAAPRVVVDLKAIPGLDAITYDATKGLTLGAMATITECGALSPCPGALPHARKRTDNHGIPAGA